VAAKGQGPKPLRWLPRPQLQSQYIYAKPAPTIDSVVAAEARQQLPPRGSSETSSSTPYNNLEPSWKAVAARQASHSPHPIALTSPSMSLTSLASTLVDKASVHSSMTLTSADSGFYDRYGWEEEHHFRRSMDSQASEQTITGLRTTLEFPPLDDRPKKGLLWKVLNMNARG